MENIGRHIKEARKGQGLTLEQLSAKTQLSIAYLSKMERGLNNLTISNLNIICKALKIDIAGMLSHSDDNHTIIRANKREMIFENEYTCLESICDPETTGITYSCTIVKENDPYPKPHSHNFDEVGVVISGTLNIVIEGISHILYPGDSVHVKSNSPRYLEKISDGPCVSYWIHLPPSD